MSALADPRRLDALHRAGLLDTLPEPAFDRLTRIAGELLRAPVALVSLVDPGRQFFKSQTGLPAPYDTLRETPLSHSFCQHVVTSEQVLAVRDARHHPVVCDNLAVRDLNVIAYLGVPLRAPDGQVLGSFCAIDTSVRDWTDADIANLKDLSDLVTGEIALREEIRRRQEAERQQRLLIAELHHRVKNTLAVVQSIIVMSLRSARSLADFRDSISARIISLANTHTLLLNQNAVATSLSELLRTELSAHHMEGRIVLEGPDAELPSQTAVSLGMCIHELMTNASKHGALSVPAGRVRLTWRAEDGDNLRLLWVESGGPKVTEPSHTGFGTTLLKRVMKSQSSGNVTLDFRPKGLQAEILLHVPPPRQQ